MKLHPFPILLGLLGLLAILVIGIGYNTATAPLPDGFPQPTPDGKIEVKSYPAYRSGTYGYSGPLRQAAEVAFEPLYRHISSNNIGMTAPVETRYPMLTLQEGLRGHLDEVGQAEVSFLYRNPNIQPQQVAQGIKVEDHPPIHVVSIGLRGAYTYTGFLQSLELLRNWLAHHPNYQVVGSPRRFFYDSPFVPDALKRSEVQIPIRVATEP